MRGLLRELWPLFAVVALTTVLALQIPRKALFFAPVPPRRQAPFASFATYGPQAYAQLVQKVRMSWQLRAQGFDATAASRVDELDLVEDYPPPPELGLPAGFARRPPAVSAAPASAPLLPPSVADAAPPRPVARPPDDGDEVRTLLRRELLEIPESLKETEKESMP